MSERRATVAGVKRSSRCVCPGSYDPITNGHIDVISRAAALFDEVLVAVVHNPNKAGCFSLDERIELAESAVAALKCAPAQRVLGRIEVEVVDTGLLVDFCKNRDASAIVKGLRGSADFGYELPMALMNRHLTGIETVFLPADPTLEHVSSSLIREVARHGGDVSGMVPHTVAAALESRFRVA